MSNVIEAIYQSGVFKPLQPVELSDDERVRLTVERRGDNHKKVVRLGGLWRGIAISKEEIDEARREMWSNLGEEEV